MRLFGSTIRKRPRGTSSPSDQDETVVHAKDQHQRVHSRKSAHGGHRSQADHHFFDDVAQALAGAHEILLIGPAQTKQEFAAYLRDKYPQLGKSIVAVENADHPSDAEILGYARRHFLRSIGCSSRGSAPASVHPPSPEFPMEAFLVSITTISVAEIGDRTQLLSLVLAARYRRPWPIIAGILCATLANHAAAGVIGVWFGSLLKPRTLGAVVGISMIAMALWTLKPDKLDEDTGAKGAMGAFLATLTSFFIAEIGDKTQIATLALAAAYPNLVAVVTGTTAGMMIANVPVVFLGKVFADRLPLKAIHYGAAVLFATLGVLFLARAFWQP